MNELHSDGPKSSNKTSVLEYYFIENLVVLYFNLLNILITYRPTIILYFCCVERLKNTDFICKLNNNNKINNT